MYKKQTAVVLECRTVRYYPPEFFSAQFQLYAVWKKIIKIENTITNNIYLLTTTGADAGDSIIFAAYDGERLVFDDICIYNSEETVPFAPMGEFNRVKVFIWKSISEMKPLCNAFDF